MSTTRAAVLDVISKIMTLVDSPWTQQEKLRKTFSPIIALRMAPKLRVLADELEATAKAWMKEP